MSVGKVVISPTMSEALERKIEEYLEAFRLRYSEATETSDDVKGDSDMSSSKAGQTGTAIVLRLSGDFNGVIVKTSSRGLWFEGQEIVSMKFAEFAPNSILNALILFTDKEEMVVQKARDRKYDVAIRVPLNDSYPPLIAVDMEETMPEYVMEMASGRLVEKKAPAPVSGYYISPETRLAYNTALKVSRSTPEKAVKIMMVGASGYGKTMTPKVFAEKAGMNHIYMDCAKIRDPEEWFGYREARDGSTVFIRSEFINALEKGNLVVVLDEFNRLEPWLHNTLYPMLDERGETTVHDETFRIGPNVIIVGTINTGYRYTGVFELDEALLNRFEFVVEVGPMPHEHELDVLMARTPGLDSADAARIVKAANTLRQQDIVCSTRTTLRIAEMVLHGMTPRQAFEMAVVKRIPQDNSGTTLRKQVVDSLTIQLGSFVSGSVEDDVFGEGGPVTEEASVDASPSLSVVLTLIKETYNLKVQAIKCMRQLKLVDGTSFSLSEAKRMVEDIANGGTVEVKLAASPSEELLKDFESSGIHAKVVVK